MADKARDKARDKAEGDLERRDATKRRRVADRILHKNPRLNEILLDSLPHPSMLIRKDRTILAANHTASQLGAKVGQYCWRSFGQSEFIPDKDKQYINDHKEMPPGGTCCVFCQADEALDKQFRAGNAEVKAWDKIWDMHWIPLDEETYLHYAIDMTYITREDEKLRMSELKHRTLAENIPGLVYRVLVKQDNRVLFFNTMLETMTGFKESEQKKGEVCSITPHIVPDDRDKVAAVVKHACDEKEPFEVEYRFKHKSGDIKWFKETGRPVFGPGDELLFIDGIITDITERKRAEKTLRDKEEKWRSLAETAPVIIMNVSRDGTIKFINRILTQHTLEQVIGTRVYDHIPQDQHDIMRKSIERVFETGKPDSFEILGDGPKGPATAWYENHIGPILDQNGKVANVTMVAIDITGRKRAEKVLAEKEERFRSFTENAPDFVIQVNHDGIIQFINRTHEGLNQEDVVGSSVFSWLPDDYVPTFKQTLAQVFEAAQPQVVEHLAGNEKAQMRWYSSHLGPIGKRGKVTSAIVVARDITERKQAEESLRESKERWQSLTRNTNDIILILDIEGNILYTNRVYPPHEMKDVVGHFIFEFMGEESNEATRESIKKLLRGEGPQALETAVRLSESDTVQFEVKYVPMLANGEVDKIIAVAKDITERKRAEEKIRLERDKLKGLFEGLACAEIGIDVVGTDYKVHLQNSILEQRFGDLAGKLCYEEYMGLKEPCQFCPMIKAVRNNKIASVELTGKDGRDYELLSAPLPNPDGTVDKAIEVVRDITERKRAEEELRWEINVDTTLARLSSALIGPDKSIECIADIVLDSAKQLTGSEHGFVSTIDPKTGDNVAYTLTHMMDSCRISVEEDRKIRFCRGADGRYPGLWGWALNTLEPFYTNSPQSHEAAHGIPQGHITLKNFLSVPAVSAGKLLGQIGLAGCETGYTNKHLGVVKQLADLYTVAVERKRAEKQLRDESAFRKAVIQRAAEGICVCHAIEEHPHVEFTVWNERMEDITGYTMEEINRLGWYQTMYPDSGLQQKAVERMERMRAGDDLATEEWEITRKDGLKRLLAISTSVIVTEGNKSHVLALMHDITEEKKTQKEREDFLKSLIDRGK